MRRISLIRQFTNGVAGIEIAIGSMLEHVLEQSEEALVSRALPCSGSLVPDRPEIDKTLDCTPAGHRKTPNRQNS